MLQALSRRARRSSSRRPSAEPDPRVRAAPALQLPRPQRGGKDLIADERDRAAAATLTYTETAALAKEQEEAFLYRAMQTDIVSQVLRRLASVRLV